MGCCAEAVLRSADDVAEGGAIRRAIRSERKLAITYLDLKDADIKDVFRTISQLTGLNIVIDPAVQGTGLKNNLDGKKLISWLTVVTITAFGTCAITMMGSNLVGSKPSFG